MSLFFPTFTSRVLDRYHFEIFLMGFKNPHIRYRLFDLRHKIKHDVKTQEDKKKHQNVVFLITVDGIQGRSPGYRIKVYLYILKNTVGCEDKKSIFISKTWVRSV